MTTSKNQQTLSIKGLLRDRDSLWYMFFEQSRDGIVIIDQEGKVFDANKQFSDMLGYTHKEILNLHVWDWDRLLSKAEIIQKIKEIDGRGHHLETKQMRKDGSALDVELSSSALLFKGRKLIFCICRDITERKLSENEIYRLATTDSLTGFFNRRAFLQQLVHEISCAQRYGASFSLAMYDFDNFKQINDVFGHLEGDKVLSLSAEQVKMSIRKCDVAGRWGGEEFMVLMPHSDLIGGQIVAEKLRCIIAAQKLHAEYSVTASFGVTEYSPRDDLDLLLRRVDKALYQAKDKGRNCVQIL